MKKTQTVTTRPAPEGKRLPAPAGPARRLGLRIWRNRSAYLMILPAIVALVVFYYAPLYGVQIAFKNFRPSQGIWGSKWVGLDQFKRFLKYPYAGQMIWNSLWINIVDLLSFPLPVIFALLLNEMRFQKLKRVCQTITYAPHFVSTVVVCAMITMFCDREGLINILGGFFGLEPSNPLEKPQLFVFILLASSIWQGLGWGTIIYLATLSNVSMDLIEAAKLDGCSRAQIIRHINLPAVLPTAVTMLILRMGSLFSTGYEKLLLLQNPLNLEASTTISTYTYEIGILNNQFSYSTAIGLFNSVINVVVILTFNAISKKVTEVSLW